jgi:hypothetical protein
MQPATEHNARDPAARTDPGRTGLPFVPIQLALADPSQVSRYLVRGSVSPCGENASLQKNGLQTRAARGGPRQVQQDTTTLQCQTLLKMRIATRTVSP